MGAHAIDEATKKKYSRCSPKEVPEVLPEAGLDTSWGEQAARLEVLPVEGRLLTSGGEEARGKGTRGLKERLQFSLPRPPPWSRAEEESAVFFGPLYLLFFIFLFWCALHP